MSMFENTENVLTEVEDNSEQVEENKAKEKITLSGLKNKISSAFEGNTVKEKAIDAAEKTAKTVGISAVTIATEIVEGTAATLNITNAQEKLYQKRNKGWNKVRGIWGKEEKEHGRLDGAEIRQEIKNVAMAVVHNAMERAEQQMSEQGQMQKNNDLSLDEAELDFVLDELEFDVAMLEIDTDLETLDIE